jgi:hypothetical protein
LCNIDHGAGADQPPVFAPSPRGAAMLDYFRALWATDSLSPHGICLLWRPELISTHVTADALIGISYFSIPIALAYFVSHRNDIQFGWVF